MDLITQFEHINIEIWHQSCAEFDKCETPTIEDIKKFRFQTTTLINSISNLLERIRNDPIIHPYYHYINEIHSLEAIKQELLDKINDLIFKTNLLISSDRIKTDQINRLEQKNIAQEFSYQASNESFKQFITAQFSDFNKRILLLETDNLTLTTKISSLETDNLTMLSEINNLNQYKQSQEEKEALFELIQIFKCVEEKLREKYGYQNLSFKKLIIQLCADNRGLANQILNKYRSFDNDPNITIINIANKLRKLNKQRNKFAHNPKIKVDKIDNNIEYFREHYMLNSELKMGLEIIDCLVKYKNTARGTRKVR